MINEGQIMGDSGFESFFKARKDRDRRLLVGRFAKFLVPPDSRVSASDKVRYGFVRERTSEEELHYQDHISCFVDFHYFIRTKFIWRDPIELMDYKDLEIADKQEVLEYFEALSRQVVSSNKEGPECAIASRKAFAIMPVVDKLRQHGIAEVVKLMEDFPYGDLFAPKTGQYVVQGDYGIKGYDYNSVKNYQPIRLNTRVNEQTVEALLLDLRPNGFGDIQREYFYKSEQLKEKQPLVGYRVFEVPPDATELIDERGMITLDLILKEPCQMEKK